MITVCLKSVGPKCFLLWLSYSVLYRKWQLCLELPNQPHIEMILIMLQNYDLYLIGMEKVFNLISWSSIIMGAFVWTTTHVHHCRFELKRLRTMDEASDFILIEKVPKEICSTLPNMPSLSHPMSLTLSPRFHRLLTVHATRHTLVEEPVPSII